MAASKSPKKAPAVLAMPHFANAVLPILPDLPLLPAPASARSRLRVSLEITSANADLTDTNYYRNSIYAIYERRTLKIVYVGLTSYERDGARFVEHVNTDIGYPWHVSKVPRGSYDSSDSSRWPYYPRNLENCKDFTPLETIAGEEYWWEYHGGLIGQLLNKNRPLTRDTFLRYKNRATYRGTDIGFPRGWEPKP